MPLRTGTQDNSRTARPWRFQLHLNGAFESRRAGA